MRNASLWIACCYTNLELKNIVISVWFYLQFLYDNFNQTCRTYVHQKPFNVNFLSIIFLVPHSLTLVLDSSLWLSTLCCMFVQTSLMYKLGMGKVFVPRNRFRLTIFPGFADRSLVACLIAVYFDGRKLWIWGDKSSSTSIGFIFSLNFMTCSFLT